MTSTSDSPLKRFFLPRLSRKFFLRLGILALSAWCFFSTVCIPAYVSGDSMLPTFHTGQLLFCWTPAFRNKPPNYGAIVMIAYSGQNVMLLKRVLAVAGETVEFQNGQLLLNGMAVLEPWQQGMSCDWNRPPEVVKPGYVFVVGDNRTMPMSEHLHGQVALSDIVGRPVGY